jgi:hypothetical protein
VPDQRTSRAQRTARDGPVLRAGRGAPHPETEALGSYGDDDVCTYNAHEHPDLVTYNVNTFDNVGDVYDDASIYRPRFIDVQLKVSG